MKTWLCSAIKLTLTFKMYHFRFLILFLDFTLYSDLALRNCLLTSDVTVKIGDYGLSHSKYKVCIALICSIFRLVGILKMYIKCVKCSTCEYFLIFPYFVYVYLCSTHYLFILQNVSGYIHIHRMIIL